MLRDYGQVALWERLHGHADSKQQGPPGIPKGGTNVWRAEGFEVTETTLYDAAMVDTHHKPVKPIKKHQEWSLTWWWWCCVDMGSSAVINVLLWGVGVLIVGEALCVGVRGIWEPLYLLCRLAIYLKLFLKIQSIRKSVLLLVIKLTQFIQIMVNHYHHFPNVADIKLVL